VPSPVATAPAGVKLSGYADLAYLYNLGTPSAAQGYATDRRPRGNFNVNQLQLALAKPLTDANQWQAGFAAAVLLGEDFAAMSGRDRGASSLYLQHAHLDLRVPLGRGLDVQLGKLCSVMGYESDERPANLNITKGASTLFDPCSATGAFLSYPVTDWLTAQAGVHNGSGADGNPGFDTSGDAYAFLASLRLHNRAHTLATQLTVQYAPWGEACPHHANHASAMCAPDNTNVIGLNWWLNWLPARADSKLLLALNTSLWSWDNTMVMPMPMPATTATYSALAAYAKYQCTPCLSLAARAEYVHTHNGEYNAARGTSYFWNNGRRDDDLYTLTLTAALNLAEDLLLRTEYRLDTGARVATTQDLAHLLALEAVYSF
jgi:hypothetical protein